jgi:uncharacterized protein DUF4340
VAPPPVTYSAASFVGLAGTIVLMVLVGVIFLTGRRRPARASREAARVFPDRTPAATLGDGVRHRDVATPAMTHSAARFAGVAGAVAMIALIGAISLTGRWPTGEIILPNPEIRGILAVPANEVAHIQVSTGEKDLVFRHQSEGGWLVNGLETEKAVSEHVDAALRLLNVSSPPRVLKPGDYSAAQVADFGLDPPHLLVSVVGNTGKTSSVTFGEATPAQNAQYVRVIGQPNIYLLPRYVGVEWELAVDMAQRLLPAGSDANVTERPSTLLLPVSMATISTVEILENGALTRFERDPEGDWFHHVGQHTHGPGAPAHKADLQLAPLLAAELTALERASIEAVVTQHPDPDTLREFGLDHPPSIILLYTRDSSRAVARIEFGKPTPDGLGRYARVQETDNVVTVPSYAAAHLDKLLQLAGARS